MSEKKVKELNDENFSMTLDSSDVALVQFYTSWCSHCKNFAPLFEKAAKDHLGIDFFKLDGDKNPKSREELEIHALPHVGVYRQGVYVKGELVRDADSLHDLVKQVLSRS